MLVLQIGKRYLFFEEGGKGEVQKVAKFVKQLEDSRFSKRKKFTVHMVFISYRYMS